MKISKLKIGFWQALLASFLTLFVWISADAAIYFYENVPIAPKHRHVTPKKSLYSQHNVNSKHRYLPKIDSMPQKAIVGNAKVVALTFDDGPSKLYTEQVLKILSDNNVKATFFVIGGSVKRYPEIFKKVFAAGHVIGNHSYTHPNFSKLNQNAIEKELSKTNSIIYANAHVYPIFFRPPFGATSALSRSVVENLGYKSVTWDYLVNDYDVSKTSPDIIANSIIKHASPGAVMVMHDGGGNRSKTVAALPKIISELKKQGYQFVTVAEIFGIEPYRR